MTDTMVLINPRKGDGRGACDARVPLRALVPGLRLTLPVNGTGHNEPPVSHRCIVRHVHYAHHWLRVEYKMGGQTLSECFKFVEEAS